MKRMSVLFCVVVLLISLAVNLWQARTISNLRQEAALSYTWDVVGKVVTKDYHNPPSFQMTMNLYKLSYPAPSISPQKQVLYVAGSEIAAGLNPLAVENDNIWAIDAQTKDTRLLVAASK